MTASPESRRLPRLHLVTDDEVLRDPRFPERVRELLAVGGERVALHLRGPSTAGRELWEHARFCADVTDQTGAWLLVNDRLDVALGCGAEGVQLGQASFSIPEARAILGPAAWIGASVHDPAEARQAAERGADFLLAGTLFRSLTHPERIPAGVTLLHDIGESRLPVVGIGGIDPDRTGEVLSAGAYGVAIIRAIWNAPDPEDAMRAFLNRLYPEV